MAQGFLTGLLWGSVAGVGLLAVSTQVIAPQDLTATPPGEVGRPDASAVEVPAGTEFDQARPATDPVIPAEETRPGGEAISGVAPPADPGTTPPAFDTSSLEMPQPVEAPGSLGEVPVPAAEVSVDVTGPGETAPQIAPVEPLAAPQNGAPAPATDTSAPNIAAPSETTAPAIEAPSAETGGDAPAVPGLAVEPQEPPATTGGDAPTAPEGSDAPAAMTAPQTSDAPVVAMADAPVQVPGADAPARPSVSTAPLGSGTAPSVEAAPEAPVIAARETPIAEPAVEPGGEGEAEDAADSATETPADSDVPSETPDAVPAEGDTATDATGGGAKASASDTASDAAGGSDTASASDAASGTSGASGAAPNSDTATNASGQNDTASDRDTGSAGQTVTPPATDATPDPVAPDAVVEAPRVRPAPGSGGTLPRVIRLVGEDEPQEAPEATPDEPETPVDPGAGALERFSVASGAGFGDAILSLVILHEGGLPDPARLAGLPRGLSFAVDAGQPDAEAVARAYRAAGREVVLIPSLPERARPQDVEQAMQANLRAVPEAVAVMDTTGGGFQSDRQAVAQVVDAIGATGHGLITFPRGLNTAHQRAEREGVPRGLIFRDIDGQGESGDEIGRSLDRAAFRARQSRQPVILVGRGLDATLSAVATWAAAKGSDGVILAPVSAALLAGN